MAVSNLGIQRLHSIEICVHDARPWMEYLCQGFGFQHLSVSTGAFIERTGTCRRLLRCKDTMVVLSEPIHAGSTVKRFLDQHPEGIRRVNFLVEDAQATEMNLIERHATLKSELVDECGWKNLIIATPLGDVEFGFIEAPAGHESSLPFMEQSGAHAPSHNPLGLVGLDHLTSHVPALMPVIAFHEHVMGLERYWDVRFHAEDLRPGVGSGLQSVIMWDRASGVRLASSEPLRPRFSESQVQMSIDINHGAGIQHVAIQVEDLVAAVDHARGAGIEFLPVPPAYYRALPARVKEKKIPIEPTTLDECRNRGILVDGDKDGYLMQVFCREQSVQFDRPEAGPLLIELVQRCGGRGFGEGNFRALFEAMERESENGR